MSHDVFVCIEKNWLANNIALPFSRHVKTSRQPDWKLYLSSVYVLYKVSMTTASVWTLTRTKRSQDTSALLLTACSLTLYTTGRLDRVWRIFTTLTLEFMYFINILWTFYCQAKIHGERNIWPHLFKRIKLRIVQNLSQISNCSNSRDARPYDQYTQIDDVAKTGS